MTYFKNFPTIFYNGQQAKNIMARARLTDDTKKEISLFYPYTIKESDGRADSLANSYYNDPFAVWMIYFANEVVDPYFDLGLDEESFNKYIIKKYGSIETAQTKIAFYRTNWELLEDSSITLENFDALTAAEKKYWNPVLDIYGSTVRYERKREDLIVNTNKIYQLTIDETENTFTVGEKVQANSTVYGYCVTSNSTSITLQHILGMNTSNISEVTGNESGSTATVTEVTVLSENLSSNVESNYWKAVSYYENETEVNTLKKQIHLLDNRYKNKIEDDLKKQMRK